MSDQMLKALLGGDALKTPAFPPGSRYHTIETATLETPDGRPIAYLKRRFVPSPDRFATVSIYTILQGDRLDNIAAHVLGDPERFWLLCDANNALDPDELSEPVGRRLLITLPEGVPGTPNG